MLLYVGSDRACGRKVKLECKEIESIFTEINVNDKKWLICGVYRQVGDAFLVKQVSFF
jgi:chaperonin cofactor prefoldin